MIAAGLAAAIVIGMVLGILGGGGSILTVPVLVYLVGLPAVQATAYSLFIVGLSAVVGAIGYIRAGSVNLRVAALFAVPSLVAVFLTRLFLVPAIPDPVATLGSVVVTRDVLIMTIFAVTMVLAALSMIRGCLRCATRGPRHAAAVRDEAPVGRRAEDGLGAGGAAGHGAAAVREDGLQISFAAVALEGLIVGTLTGLVGAGGGFLIIPALVLIAGLPMKQAVGTSLVIIAAKSLIGFLGDIGATTAIDWGFLIPFTAVTALGIIVGMILTRRIESAKLRPAFGWFVLGMGAFITVQQVLATTVH